MVCPSCSLSAGYEGFDIGGVLTVDLQLLRNGSMNAAQVALLGEAWKTDGIVQQRAGSHHHLQHPVNKR